MKLKYFAYVSLASVFLAGCREVNKGAVVPLVLMTDVGSVSTDASVNYPGRVVSDEKASVSFMVSGTIQKVYVKQGDYVRAGQTIAQLNTRDYQTQLNATKAEYTQIKAEVDRVLALYQEHVVTANDYDKARYGLQQIEQKLNHHKSQLSDCTLRAPYDGYISEVNFHQGETVMSGMPVASIFRNSLEVVIDLSASDFRRCEKIESACATFKILDGKEFPLKLRNVSHSTNNNQLYQTHFSFAGKVSDITPGMSAMVSIRFNGDIDREDNLLPSNAIFVKDSQTCVFVWDKADSTIHIRPVQVLSLSSSGDASVSGLESGQTVVTAGVSKLFDGQKVRRVEPASETNPGGLL